MKCNVKKILSPPSLLHLPPFSPTQKCEGGGGGGYFEENIRIKATQLWRGGFSNNITISKGLLRVL
jgi:hypothetical protein